MAKENWNNLKPLVDEHYKHRRTIELQFKEKYPNKVLINYDLHDGKMIYLLTQHTSYSRKNHPFLLCGCKRNESVKKLLANSTYIHECKMFTDDEVTKLYNKSDEMFKKQLDLNKEYSHKEHVKWADESNFGITHFGVHPEQLLYSKIRLDTFHMICQITRKLLTNVRKFIMRHDQDLITDFVNNVLQDEWSVFNIDVFESNKPISIYQGKDLYKFIDLSNDIETFFESNFVSTTYSSNITKCLSLWNKISHTLRRCTIFSIDDDNDTKTRLIKEYIDEMNGFEKLVQDFYKYGCSTFLSCNDSSEQETFYLHALRFYMPKFMKETWKTHRLGVGVFTMQGMERRNQESKKALQNHTNNRGNIIVQNLMKLYGNFIPPSN